MSPGSPKLIAVDLDGTLLDARGEPHERDVRALRAAIESGIRVSIITGRLYSGTRAVAACVGIRGAVGCADGSHIVRSADHSTLLHHGLRDAHATHLRDTLAAGSIAAFVFAEDAIGHDPRGAPFVGYVSTWSRDVRPAVDVFAHELWSCARGITGAVGLGSRESIARAEEELGRVLPGVYFVATFPVRRTGHDDLWAMFVRASGGTKGTALRWIAEHEGVPLADTVCVGDWLNDIPMFEVAGRSFAMAQAPAELRSKATDVLPETAQQGGGVASAVRAAFGIDVG